MEMSQRLSLMMFIIPIAFLLRPKGSCEPVGIKSTAKSPTMVSSLSAIASIEPVVVEGSSPPAYLGMYCSSIAFETISGSLQMEVYMRPIAPWSSVNSCTIFVARSNFESSAARLTELIVSSPTSNTFPISILSFSTLFVFSNIVPNFSWKVIFFNSSMKNSEPFSMSSL